MGESDVAAEITAGNKKEKVNANLLRQPSLSIPSLVADDFGLISVHQPTTDHSAQPQMALTTLFGGLRYVDYVKYTVRSEADHDHKYDYRRDLEW